MALAGRPDRLFDGLLRLLPQEFRDRHGREIVQVFRAERAEAVTPSQRASVWIRTALGLLRTAPAEHLSILRQDVRFAARGLARHPIFAIVAVLTLALPIGAATAMFGLLNTLAFQPLPFPDVDRMLIVDQISTAPDGAKRRLRTSQAAFDALRARDDLFEGVAAHRRGSFTFPGAEGGEWVAAAMVAHGWSQLLPARPTLGRAFSAEEERGGSASRVAMVSRRLWDSHVSEPKRIPGATLELDGERYRIVGVLPDSYRYPYGAEIWIPATYAPEHKDLLVAARAREGVSLETINRELASEAARLSAIAPVSRGDFGLEATTIRRSLIAGADRTAWLLLGAVALLLLIASANVVHLLFVRLAGRQREFCIRGALGANRSRQIRQMVTETIVLFGIAAVVGLLAAPLVSRMVFLLVPQVLRTQFGVHAIDIDRSLVASPAHSVPGARVRAIDRAISAVQRLPGVVSATASSVNPLCCYDWGSYLVPEGRVEAAADPLRGHHHGVAARARVAAPRASCPRGRIRRC